METPHNFDSSMKKGDIGEGILLDFLTGLPSVKEVVNVSNDPTFFEKDIDFIVEFKNGKKQTVEIKTDFYTSPNFFYETMSAVETNSIGCFEKTEAERLLYYYIKLGKLYIFDMEKYRSWVHENRELLVKKGYKKRLKNYRYDGSTYTSEGFAFPRRMLESQNVTWMTLVEMPEVAV